MSFQQFKDISFFATTTTGSTILKPWCDVLGLPIDKVNFLFSQLVFIPLAFCFRLLIAKEWIPNYIKHLFLLVPGLTLGFFCFGYQVFNLVILTFVTYLLIIVCPGSIVQRFLFTVSIVYLSCLHIFRQIYDYGGYTIDITGPSMIAIQKISLVGFSLHDGYQLKKKDKLDNEYFEKVAIRKTPTILEYFSYLLQFPTLMSGPTIHFHDYIEFVEGTNFSKHLSKKDIKPTPNLVFLEKLFTSVLFAFLFVYLTPYFPVQNLVTDNNFKNQFTFLIFMIISTTLVRFKYYHAWKLGESLLNCCGFGFNGLDKDKKPKWDLISSVDIISFEFATNLRDGLNYWNKTTQSWLRFVAYDRTKTFKIGYTYLLSAVWHGFYPGYYFTFLSAGLFTQTGRVLRRHLRPLFLGNKLKKGFYDFLTFCATKFTIAYLVFPFVLLEFNASFKVYQKLYFIGHIGCLLIIILLPLLIKSKKN